jgi:hypothetical protein
MATNDTQPKQIKDGDDWFLGFASRLDPGNLPEKMLQASENMRLQRGTATIRLGAQRLNGYLTDARIGQVNSTTTYTDPATGYEYILMVLESGLMLCYQDGETYKYIEFTYSTNSFPVGVYFPRIPLGSEVQAIQALNKVYILRGAATTPAAAVTFTNATISPNTWGTFTVSGFPFRKWVNIPYTKTGTEFTMTLPRDHGFALNDLLEIYSPVNFTGEIIEITNTTVKVDAGNQEIIIPSTGVLSFMLYYDLYNTEFIVQSTHEPKFNGTYPVQDSSTITTTGAVTFHHFNSTSGNISANTNQSGMTLLQARSPIVWDGVSTTASPVNQTAVMTSTTAKIPPADFGIYFQTRLVLKVSDHFIAVSDYLSDTFDMTLNNFNINLGSGDSIIGFLPWIENQFLVFMGRAIYLAYIETTNYLTSPPSPPGANSRITVVTNEVGCLARRTIVNAGQFVFFLSPKGVHMLTPQLDLKLLGNTQPLSEPIADFFDALNYTTAFHSCAAYYNNRFYVSVPYSGSIFNSRIAVYNTLNQQWESIDAYQNDMFVDEFFICSFGNERRLMAGCRIWAGWRQFDIIEPMNSAGVALFEEVQDVDRWTYVRVMPGNTLEIQSTPIQGLMRTREYMFDSLSEKRFTRAQVQTSNIADDRIVITASAYDPDSQEMILDYTFEGGTHTTLRPRVALRGSAIDIQVQILSGSPSVKTISVTGITTDRQMISQE